MQEYYETLLIIISTALTLSNIIWIYIYSKECDKNKNKHSKK